MSLSPLVTIHSIWRWVLLLAALAAIIKAFAGWLGHRPYDRLDQRLGMLFTMAVDIQALLGIILWITERRFAVFAGGPAATGEGLFYGLEHPVLMLIALGLAHVGYSRSRRAPAGANPHRTAALFYLASFILIIAGIPWDRLAR